MRVKLTLEYDGANYCGWQWQPAQDSIQARLEAALARILSQPVRVRAAGRTDAGVHAAGQVAAFDLPREFALDELARALNAILPADIAVRAADAAPDNFDPRRDARARVYEYHILNQAVRSAFAYRYAWLVRDPLDTTALESAAHAFLGEHDFAAFRSIGSEEKSTIRRIYRSAWGADGLRLIYTVEATAFLRHMVRTMVGAMVEVGRGRMDCDALIALIESRDRARAPASAPACGLFLTAVRY
ncbi:MAG: tRNA pseudouridine(38-40) synthase TruA [Candidatus Binataceae bacterium]